MIKIRRRTAIIVGITTLALAGGGAAYAATAGGPVDSGGVIHGCYTTQALNGSHVFVLQDAGTTCPKGTTAVQWNQAGPPGAAGSAGPAGPAGPAGATGPMGPAGAASLDALNGTPCNAGSSSQGVLSVSYGSQGSVSLTCTPTTLYTLSVSVSAGDGKTDLITSSPAGIDCGPAVSTPVCSASFPTGYKVTLTAAENGGGGSDVVDGWSGGGCPAHVNIDRPYTVPGVPSLSNPVVTDCTVTMSADTTVSASFGGDVRVINVSPDVVNFIPDPGGLECTDPAFPNCKGIGLQTGGTNNTADDVIPYGTVVTITGSGPASSISFNGWPACSPSQAGTTLTPTSCTFTMSPGDALGLEEQIPIS